MSDLIGGSVKDASSEEKPIVRAPEHVFGSFADLKLEERPESPVFAHVRIERPSELLEKIHQHLVPTSLTSIVDDSSIRGMIGLQLGVPAAVMEKIDFQQPIVCALLKFDPYDFRGGCAFSYSGEVHQLVKDWKAKRKVKNPGEHAAILRVKKNKIFVDRLGSRVVLSGEDRDFSSIQKYLENEFATKTAYQYGDLEIEGYLGDYLQIQGFADKIIEEDRKTLEVRSRRRPPLFQLWRRYQQLSRELILRDLTESVRFNGFLRIDEWGLRFGLALIPRAGSRFYQRSRAQARDADTILAHRLMMADLVEHLPAESIVVGASLFDVGAIEPEILQFVSQAIAEMSGRSPEETAAMVDGISQAQQKIYGEPYAWAWVDHESSMFALTLLRSLKKDQRGRHEWLRLSDGFTADSILGPKQLEYVRWAFHPAHRRQHGFLVDRWTLAPGKSLLRVWKKELPRKTRQQLLRQLGSFELKLDRVELEDRVIYASAPRFEESLVTRLLDAHEGKMNLHRDKGLARLRSLHPDRSGYLAINVAALRQWLLSKESVAQPIASLMGEIGHDYSDLHLSWQHHQDGKLTGQLVVSQPLIDQIRKISDARFNATR